MNNSDHNDFSGWQNEDENEMNNPNNWFPGGGFFYYKSNNDAFKKIWDSIHNGENPMDYMKEYMNMDDYPKNSKRRPKNKNENKFGNKTTVFNQDDYLKLIEIRGYLNITEQYAHVKALDKLLNQIQIITKDGK